MVVGETGGHRGAHPTETEHGNRSHGHQPARLQTCDKRRSSMVSMRIRHDARMALTPWNAFVEVCRTGSIRAAAEATGFTQPGLSRQVAALEREVGTRLLHRGARGVTPTAAGAALLPHARLVVNEARRGREAARTATDRPAHDPARRGPVGDRGSLVPRAIGRLRGLGWPGLSRSCRRTHPAAGPDGGRARARRRRGHRRATRSAPRPGAPRDAPRRRRGGRHRGPRPLARRA